MTDEREVCSQYERLVGMLEEAAIYIEAAHRAAHIEKGAQQVRQQFLVLAYTYVWAVAQTLQSMMPSVVVDGGTDGASGLPPSTTVN